MKTNRSKVSASLNRNNINVNVAKNIMRVSFILAIASLAGCGGGSSGTPKPTPTPTSTPTPGNSGQSVGSTLPWSNVQLNAVAVNGAGTVYTGGSVDVNNGVVLANNTVNGAWQPVGAVYLPNVNQYIFQVSAIAVTDPNVVYAAVNSNYQVGGVVSNQGTGGAWAWMGAGFSSPDGGIVNSLAVGKNGLVYAATAGYTAITNQFYGNVYNVTGGISGAWSSPIGNESAPDGGVVNSIAVSDAGVVYAAAGGYNVTTNVPFGDVYSNTGSGGNWQEIGGGPLPESGVPNSMVLSVDNKTIFAATSTGKVYSASTSGGNWQLYGQGAMPDSGAINSIAISASGVIYAATSLGNIYGSNGTEAWQLIGGGSMPDGWFINSIATYQQKIYAVTQGGNTYTNAIK